MSNNKKRKFYEMNGNKKTNENEKKRQKTSNPMNMIIKPVMKHKNENKQENQAEDLKFGVDITNKNTLKHKEKKHISFNAVKNERFNNLIRNTSRSKVISTNGNKTEKIKANKLTTKLELDENDVNDKLNVMEKMHDDGLMVIIYMLSIRSMLSLALVSKRFWNLISKSRRLAEYFMIKINFKLMFEINALKPDLLGDLCWIGIKDAHIKLDSKYELANHFIRTNLPYTCRRSVSELESIIFNSTYTNSLIYLFGNHEVTEMIQFLRIYVVKKFDCDTGLFDSIFKNNGRNNLPYSRNLYHFESQIWKMYKIKIVGSQFPQLSIEPTTHQKTFKLLTITSFYSKFCKKYAFESWKNGINWDICIVTGSSVACNAVVEHVRIDNKTRVVCIPNDYNSDVDIFVTEINFYQEFSAEVLKFIEYLRQQEIVYALEFPSHVVANVTLFKLLIQNEIKEIKIQFIWSRYNASTILNNFDISFCQIAYKPNENKYLYTASFKQMIETGCCIHYSLDDIRIATMQRIPVRHINVVKTIRRLFKYISRGISHWLLPKQTDVATLTEIINDLLRNKRFYLSKTIPLKETMKALLTEPASQNAINQCITFNNYEYSANYYVNNQLFIFNGQVIDPHNLVQSFLREFM